MDPLEAASILHSGRGFERISLSVWMSFCALALGVYRYPPLKQTRKTWKKNASRKKRRAGHLLDHALTHSLQCVLLACEAASSHHHNLWEPCEHWQCQSVVYSKPGTSWNILEHVGTSWNVEKWVGKRWSAVDRKKFTRGTSSFKQLGSSWVATQILKKSARWGAKWCVCSWSLLSSLISQCLATSMLACKIRSRAWMTARFSRQVIVRLPKQVSLLPMIFNRFNLLAEPIGSCHFITPSLTWMCCYSVEHGDTVLPIIALHWIHSSKNFHLHGRPNRRLRSHLLRASPWSSKHSGNWLLWQYSKSFEYMFLFTLSVLNMCSMCL